MTKLRLNPWKTMWLKPRETIREIIKHDPRHLVIILAALLGISRIIDRAGLYLPAFLITSPFLTLFVVLVIGSVAGIVIVYVNAAFLEFTGKFIGGQGTSKNLRAATVWSNVPNFWVLPFEVLTTAVLPLLVKNPTAIVVPYALVLIAGIVTSIWSFVLYLHSIGEVHRFSAWKALAALILSVIALLAVILVVALAAILSIKVLS